MEQWLNLILEWASWVLLFFSWAILVKTAMRRFRKKHPGISLKERPAYYTAMSVGILCFVLLLLFVVDPLISGLVGEEVVVPDDGPIVFWSLAILLFLTLPFLLTGFIYRLFRVKQDQSNR
jgi:hypothetical protein